jgi:hypothetical protein
MGCFVSRNLQPNWRTAKGTDSGADQRYRPQVWDGIQIGRLKHFSELSRRARNWPKRTSLDGQFMSAVGVPAQPVDATQALNLSAGVSNCKVLRGRSFS